MGGKLRIGRFCSQNPLFIPFFSTTIFSYFAKFISFKHIFSLSVFTVDIIVCKYEYEINVGRNQSTGKEKKVVGWDETNKGNERGSN